MSGEHTRTWIRTAALLLPLCCPLLSCNGDLSLGSSVWKDSFLQSASVSADVLFVVDNSQSMQQEQALMVAAFGDFISHIEESNTDFHIGVTTTDMSDKGAQGKLIEYQLNPSDPNTYYKYITSHMDPAIYEQVFEGMIAKLGSGTGWEAGLWAAKSALYPRDDHFNDGFLRNDAELAIIFISDEDDCSDEYQRLPHVDQGECYDPDYYQQLKPVYEYVSEFQSLKNDDEDVILAGILGLPSTEKGTECDTNTTPGNRYIQGIDEFGGFAGDICQSEFSSILSQLGLSAGGIRSHFELSRTPDATTLKVFIDEVEIPSSSGWLYDATTNAVDFYGDAIPPRDTSILITYELG